jgi:hypothetical protein
VVVVLTVTVTATVVECVNNPDVPVTVSVNVDGVTEGSILTVNVEEAVLPLDGVTGLGVNVAETPLGSPDTLKSTGELNPLIELKVTVEDADPPTPTVMGAIELREKSAEGAIAIE